MGYIRPCYSKACFTRNVHYLFVIEILHSCLFKFVFGIQYLTFFFLYNVLEPAQNSVKYLTWHRTASSRSSSSKNPLDANSRENLEDVTNNLFDSSYMISGSHASTLDRLYAWEKKLYDEVKVPCISYQQIHQPLRILYYIFLLVVC